MSFTIRLLWSKLAGVCFPATVEAVIRLSVFFLQLSDDYRQALRIASKRHDLIAVTISDPREWELPKLGIMEFQDAETGEIVLIDTANAGSRDEFRRLVDEQMQRRDELFRSAGVDAVSVQTDKPYIGELLRFFRMRERRFG